ncbi:SEFIR domain-containing protein [Burkholderia gladioli]|uniref:SEFIR domain-containing protein n=1 Tax=Burkholderia gladioli TaxID=28095 RepID=UPI001640133A|nr:SEFIR domain-containing protein [Burkholderia gladioli]
MIAPKLFISYSWSNSEHEQRVVEIATDLRESGVDVILDKWDLKEGHDSVAFMEKMVTDPEIKKVAIICDEKYAAKADGRAGGVGTETQIISREVYENQSQDKFVAVVFEKDGNGKAFLPTYYKSRIYIDLSEADRYSENFERLLRWIFDKPLYVKPEIGNKPSFLSDGVHLSLGTTAIFKRCVDAIKNHKLHAAGSFDEYCTSFVENLETFRISSSVEEFDDAVIGSIEEFLPFRNEAIQIFVAIAQYAPEERFVQRLHRFFESLIPYMKKPQNISQWREWDFDNYKFIVHELFLYALAVLIKYDRMEQANYLFQQHYYLPENSDRGRDVMVGFTVFREYMRSLEIRNARLGLRRLSLRADLLKGRCAGTGVDFRYLLQADFVAFMRAEVEAQGDSLQWWPETLVYLGHFNSPFEVFARSISKTYFNKSKVLLSIETPKDLEPLLQSYQDGARRLPRWEFERFDPASLLGYEHLATRP